MQSRTKPAESMRNLIACVLFALVLQPCGWSQRIRQSMGQYIQQSAAIALVDTKKGPPPKFDTILEFREFLKGPMNTTQRTASVALKCVMLEAPYVPPDTTGVAVLLAEGWDQSQCPLLEAYQKPEEIAALRTLVEIYTLSSEHDRLEALRALVNDPNRLFRAQLFDDLGQMREPANFQIILDLYDSLDVADQSDVIDLLKDIGDIRAVPTLLKALQSPSSALRENAASVLENTFRGGPGVDDALLKYRSGTRIAPETRFQKAERLWKSNQRQRGRSLFLAVARDAQEDDFSRLYAASTVASSLTPSERAELQPAIRSFLAGKVEKGNYLELRDVAKILRALRNAENLDLLIGLLERKEEDLIYQETPCIATMAIRDLGKRAQEKAAEQLLARIPALYGPYREIAKPTPQLLALAWLGNEVQWKRIENWRWGPLQSLLGVGQQLDEGLFLIRVLQDRSDLPQLAREWIAVRLGDLKEKRAVPELIGLLTNDIDSSAMPSATQALVGIGGPAVEAETAKLLTHPRQDVRVSAIDILCRLQGAKTLPLLRRMVLEKDFGDKSSALHWLGDLGTPEDLKTLIPIADFWTGDRPNHYWAMLAVAEIRERYGYNLHGAMAKNASKPPAS